MKPEIGEASPVCTALRLPEITCMCKVQVFAQSVSRSAFVRVAHFGIYRFGRFGYLGEKRCESEVNKMLPRTCHCRGLQLEKVATLSIRLHQDVVPR